jgi:IS66 C-terminal element
MILEMSAKMNGLNPEAYLRDTLTKIAEDHPINRIDKLMPWVEQNNVERLSTK